MCQKHLETGFWTQHADAAGRAGSVQLFIVGKGKTHSLRQAGVKTRLAVQSQTNKPKKGTDKCKIKRTRSKTQEAKEHERKNAGTNEQRKRELVCELQSETVGCSGNDCCLEVSGVSWTWCGLVWNKQQTNSRGLKDYLQRSDGRCRSSDEQRWLTEQLSQTAQLCSPQQKKFVLNKRNINNYFLQWKLSEDCKNEILYYCFQQSPFPSPCVKSLFLLHMHQTNLRARSFIRCWKNTYLMQIGVMQNQHFCLAIENQR